MDTREKILSLTTLFPLLAKEEWLAVAGSFDPLTLAQAERIAALARREPARKILVVVLPGGATLLPPEARAALVAALRDVSAVVIGDVTEIRARGVPVDENEIAEQERSKAFIDFVLARQQGVRA